MNFSFTLSVGPNLRDIFEEMREMMHLQNILGGQWQERIRGTITEQTDNLFHLLEPLSLYLVFIITIPYFIKYLDTSLKLRRLE